MYRDNENKKTIETAPPKEIAVYLQELHKIAMEISCGKEDDGIWKILYNKVFSDEINGKIQERFNFDWHDPDSTYCADVTAYIKEFYRKYHKGSDENKKDDIFPDFEETEKWMDKRLVNEYN